jgi:endo-1,4-beta-xylanase
VTLRLCIFLAAAVATFPADSLKDAAAKRGIRIGAAVQSGYIANEPLYTSTLTREFSMVEPEYEMLWSAIHPSPTTYNFTGADKLVAFAASNNMLVRADHLVWHSSLPAWLTNGNFTSTQLSELLHDHITAVAIMPAR